MAFLRNILLMALFYMAYKTLMRFIEKMEAQRVKVKAKADEHMAKMPRLKLDPVTGTYRPEV